MCVQRVEATAALEAAADDGAGCGEDVLDGRAPGNGGRQRRLTCWQKASPELPLTPALCISLTAMATMASTPPLPSGASPASSAPAAVALRGKAEASQETVRVDVCPGASIGAA